MTGTLNAMIRDGIAAGRSYTQISAQTGWSRSAIRRRAERMGLRSTNAGGQPKIDSPPADLEAARERIAAGDSFTAIGRVLGIARQTVIRLTDEHSLHMEPTREQLEAMFAAGTKSREIALRTGRTPQEIAAGRKEWTARRQREISQEREAAKLVVPEPVVESDGDKLSRALRTCMPLGGGFGAWLRDDAKRLDAVEHVAEAARQPAPSLRQLALPPLREVRAAA